MVDFGVVVGSGVVGSGVVGFGVVGFDVVVVVGVVGSGVVVPGVVGFGVIDDLQTSIPSAQLCSKFPPWGFVPTEIWPIAIVLVQKLFL